MTADWIAVDWGTSTLRAWAMSQDAQDLATASSTDGMGQLASAEFEPALLRLVEPWLEVSKPTPVIACGMVGAKQGWVEATYAPTPASLNHGSPRPQPVIQGSTCISSPASANPNQPMSCAAKKRK